MERPVTVAVLDGNARTRHGLTRILEQMPGISVVGEAGDPDEAVGLLRARRPDVALADVPRLAPDAPAFLGRLIRAAPRTAVVVLTAYITARQREDMARAGARAFLLKEIDSWALARTIETVAEQSLGEERRAET